MPFKLTWSVNQQVSAGGGLSVHTVSPRACLNILPTWWLASPRMEDKGNVRMGLAGCLGAELSGPKQQVLNPNFWTRGCKGAILIHGSPSLRRDLFVVKFKSVTDRQLFYFLSSWTQAQFSPGCLDQHPESYYVPDLVHTSFSNIGNSDGFFLFHREQ